MRPTSADIDERTLVYLNNRYHDPTLGTFLSVDPLVSVTGEPYIYASGNPTTLSDPAGLAPCEDEGNCAWSNRPSANDSVAKNADALVRELYRCADALSTCQRQRTDSLRVGGDTAMANVVLDFLLAMVRDGSLRLNDAGALTFGPKDMVSYELMFEASVADGAVTITAIAAELPPGGPEDLMEQLALGANVIEMANLSSCAATGVTCLAVPYVSGTSFVLDVTNIGIDTIQGDWGEAGMGLTAFIGGQVIGAGAKEWLKSGFGTAEGFQAFIGTGWSAATRALEAGYEGLYVLPDGGQYTYRALQRTYSL